MYKIFFAAFTILWMPAHTIAQQRPVKVLLLGCFHFDNPGLDVAKFEDANIMSPTRQKEVAEVVEKLKAFKPDKIFVEYPTQLQSRLDSSYASYLAGKKELTASETHQLGFRLAKQLNHTKLYAIDERSTEFPMDSLVKVLMANQQFGMLQYIKQSIDSIQNDFNGRLKTQTIRELLIEGNNANTKAFQVGGYFEFLKAGDLSNHVGSYLTSEWWRRNMMIYGNLQKCLSGKEERVLVIFGSGHTALLEEMMKYNKQIEIVPVAQALR
jgi:hypothetical protein